MMVEGAYLLILYDILRVVPRVSGDDAVGKLAKRMVVGSFRLDHVWSGKRWSALLLPNCAEHQDSHPYISSLKMPTSIAKPDMA